jgi:hypothetical protein
MEKGAATSRPLIGAEARVPVLVSVAVPFDVMVETCGGRSGAWSTDVEASGYGREHAWKWHSDPGATRACNARLGF